MKMSKPSKQTLLKGLLLLVVGVNFSWKPLLKETGSISLAQSAVVQETVKGNTITIGDQPQQPAKNKDWNKIVTVCDNKRVGVTLLDDSTMKLRLVDDKNKEIDCVACQEEFQMNVTTGNLKDAVAQAVNGMKISCDALISTADQAKKDKEAEEKRLNALKRQMKCEINAEGKELDDKHALSCELANMKKTDEQFKEAGIGKEEADGIRQDLANAAMSDVAATCKADKKDGDFSRCEEQMDRLKTAVSKLGTSSRNKDMKAATDSILKKVAKLDDFVTKEKKVVEDVEKYKEKFDKIQDAMDKDILSMTDACNKSAARYSSTNFDVDACTLAYERKYLPAKYGTQIKQLTTQFTAEERKMTSEFDSMKKDPIIGSDGAKAAIAPFVEYTKSFADFSTKYSIPQSYLPVNPDDQSTNIANASQNQVTNWVQADIDARMGHGTERQFTPMMVGSNTTTGMNSNSTSVSGFAIPSVLSGNSSIGGRSTYRQTLPTQRSSAVTAGLFQDVSPMFN